MVRGLRGDRIGRGWANRQVFRFTGSERKYAIIGVALVGAAYMFGSLFAALSLGWEGSYDAYDHLDYILQVGRGDLPEPFGHDLDPALWSIDQERVDGRQLASAHPPLFYWIGSHLVGSLLEAGQSDASSMVAAVSILRGFNILLGALSLAFLSWTGWVIGGRLRAPLAIAVPSVGALGAAHLRFAGEVYSDMLLCFASSGALAVAATLLMRGPTTGRVLSIAALAVVGAGSKATFVLVLVIVSIALGLASYLHLSQPPRQRIAVGAGLGLVPALAAVASFGWFYARNAQLSGYWYRSVPIVPVGHRPYQSLQDNLANWDYYAVVPERLFGNWIGGVLPWSSQVSLVLFVSAATATLAVWLYRWFRRSVRLSAAQYVMVGMVAVLLFGAYLIQLAHATGYGAYNTRYFLPATFAVSLLLVGGIVTAPRARIVAIPLFSVLLIVGSSVSEVVYSIGASPLRDGLGSAFEAMSAVTFSSVALVALLGLAVVAAAATSVPLWCLRHFDLGGDIVVDIRPEAMDESLDVPPPLTAVQAHRSE